jgi:hypothetical protein
MNWWESLFRTAETKCVYRIYLRKLLRQQLEIQCSYKKSELVEKILRKLGFARTGSESHIWAGLRIISVETWLTWKSLNRLCKNRNFLS